MAVAGTGVADAAAAPPAPPSPDASASAGKKGRGSRSAAKARQASALSRWQRFKRDRVLIAMMLPGFLFFLVFQYAGQFGNVIAFKNYIPFMGISGSDWVGLQNFDAVLSDPAFWHAFTNSLELAALQLVFYFPIPLGVAILLHSLTRGAVRKVVVSVLYLPHFISWVIVVALFQQVLGATGVLNGFFSDGTGHHHLIEVFGNPAAFKPLMIGELIWKDCGWGTIIFLAALFQVDEQLYEAAALDGASPFQRFRNVTLPSMRPVIILLLIMRLGDILSVGFDQVMQQRDSFGPRAAEVLDTFVYYHGVQDGSFSVSAVAGLFKGLIAAILVIGANKLAHKFGEQGIYQ